MMKNNSPQQPRIEKADIVVRTTPQGYPTICIPKTNSYGITGVIQKVFNDDSLMQRCRNLIEEHYEEPRATQAIVDLNRRQEEYVESLLERIAKGNVKTARYVMENIPIDLVYRVSQNMVVREEGEHGEMVEYPFKEKVLSHPHFQYRKYEDVWEWVNKIT